MPQRSGPPAPPASRSAVAGIMVWGLLYAAALASYARLTHLDLPLLRATTSIESEHQRSSPPPSPLPHVAVGAIASGISERPLPRALPSRRADTSNFSWVDISGSSDAGAAPVAPKHPHTTRAGQQIRLAESGVPFAISHERALRCLRGRHLVMIGDSTMRFSYLNLAHWLATGSWYSEPAVESGAGDNTGAWPSWLAFYANTTAALARPDGSSREFCDCFRQYGSFEDVYENRHYRDWRSGVSVSFLQVLGRMDWFAPAGHALDWLSSAGCALPAHVTGTRCYGARQEGCVAGHCSNRTHHLFNTAVPFSPAMSRGIFAPVELYGGNGSVDTLVINAGHWYCVDPGYAAPRLIAGGQEALRRGVRRLYWRATTATTGPRPPPCPSEWAMFPALRAAGWRTLDAYNATAALWALGPGGAGSAWYDERHLHQRVNRGLNEMLLTDMLDDCPE